MKIGDLVRFSASSMLTPEANLSGLGIVSDIDMAWPNDPRETDLNVSVTYPDGTEETWYDWQLEVINENR